MRRVRRLREVLGRLAARVERYRELDHYTFNEDVFFGVEVNRYWPNLRIPGWRTALGFSWETQPASAFQHCGGALPFGCHAWNKWFPEDWRRIFAKAGLSLDQLL